MIERILFALKQLKYYRKDLKEILKHSDYTINNVLEMDISKIKASGIKVMVLDFDGVLAAHGEDEPSDSVKVWLGKLVDAFGEDHIYILSNKPTQVRLEYFKKQFPLFQFISGVRKKPYPDGLEKVISLSKVQAEHIALVDDRLLTGCMAALIAKTQPIYIKKAQTNYKKRPLIELFFAFLRKAERLMV
ncbi:HAD family hydrolase [Thiotrichales bacterium 19S3-7]|nr:HAD family hydrolase [Thiotrichales bacterium 19S3-7]MCF6802344.1 HAD family hydrolase [Thiotrichales bacterium 19S3-11]